MQPNQVPQPSSITRTVLMASLIYVGLQFLIFVPVFMVAFFLAWDNNASGGLVFLPVIAIFGLLSIIIPFLVSRSYMQKRGIKNATVIAVLGIAGNVVFSVIGTIAFMLIGGEFIEKKEQAAQNNNPPHQQPPIDPYPPQPLQ